MGTYTISTKLEQANREALANIQAALDDDVSPTDMEVAKGFNRIANAIQRAQATLNEVVDEFENKR